MPVSDTASNGSTATPEAIPYRPVFEEVTTPDQWVSPRRVGFPVRLPSGNVARVKRVMSILEMLKNGKIPNPLASHLEAWTSQGRSAFNIADLDEGAQIQAIDFINGVVMDAVTMPKVVVIPEGESEFSFEAPQGSITIEDLSWEDRLFIYQVAQGGVASVEQFRQVQEKYVESLQASEGVALPTVEPARPKRAGSGSKRKR